MRFLVFLLGLLIASTAMATPDCLIGGSGDFDWGPWITITSNGGNCNNVARAPLTTEIVGVVDGAVANIITTGLAATTDAAAIEVQSGAEWNIDATDATGLGFGTRVTLFGGQDGVGEGAYDDVALWIRPGAKSTIRAGYLERYPSDGTPNWISSSSIEDKTIFTVGHVVTCDMGTTDEVGWSQAAVLSCTSLSREYRNTLSYTVPRNNPLDGTANDNYLLEAFVEAATTFASRSVFIYMLTGLDAGHLYEILGIDAAGSILGFNIDTRQGFSGYVGDAAAFPNANKFNMSSPLQDSVATYPAGSTCIETENSIISADGDGRGFCMYVYENGGTNGLERPLPIGDSKDSLDCDGNAAVGDSFYFAPENALPKTFIGTGSPGRVVMSASCIGAGDEYVVMNPPQILISASGHVAGEGKILIEGEADWKGLIIAGSAEVICDTGSCDFENVHILQGGESAVPALYLKDQDNFNMVGSSVVGGPATGNGDGILIEGGENYHFQRVNMRYIGDDFLEVTGDEATVGSIHLDEVSCERVGKASSPAATMCIKDQNGAASYVGIRELFVSDIAVDVNSAIFSMENGSPYVSKATASGVAVANQAAGVITKAQSSPTLELFDLTARMFTMSGSGPAGTLVDRHLSRCDVLDLVVSTQNSTVGLTAQGPTTIENCIFENFLGYSTVMFKPTDSYGSSFFRNNLIIDANTVATGNANHMFSYTADDDDTTVLTIEDNTFVWTDSGNTLWTDVVASVGTDHSNDKIRLDGNAIIQMNNNSATADAPVKGYNLGPNITADIEYKAGRANCISTIEASGAGSPTVEYVANPTNYVEAPILGEPPTLGFGQTTREKSLMAFRSCGVLTGKAGPGVKGQHPYLSERMGFLVGEK